MGVSYPGPAWLGWGRYPEAWMSGLRGKNLNFLAICHIFPTKSQLNYIINASVKDVKAWVHGFSKCQLPILVAQTDPPIRNRGKAQLELFEVRVEACSKAELHKHSTRSQRLNMLGFLSCMICSTLLLPCSLQ